MAFALALAARFLAQSLSSALVVGENFAVHEGGALYGPGLVALGLPLNRLIFVSAPDASAVFWAMEEALKCGAPAAVVGEIMSLRTYDLLASRRLLLAARKGKTPALVVLAGAHGQADRLSTAAETRFEIAAARSEHIPTAAGRGLPGPLACTARIVKARDGFPHKTRLEWRSEYGAFDDPAAISFALATAPGDRPRAAAPSH
jgi:protein ImuA